MTTQIRYDVMVNGEKLIAKETFKACGTLWVRYVRLNRESGYATAQEWTTWGGEPWTNLNRALSKNEDI